ncbi:hypothetical protein ACXDF8_13950 [Mycolicibacterium sp. CBM1]
MIEARSDELVDAAVAEIGPGLPPPAITRIDAVLVVGPWLAGTSSVVAALRQRRPAHRFVEATDLAAGEAPVAVVFVVSAAAPLTESDCALLDAAAADTDVVVGVVTKIDVHRSWPEVLDANRTLLADHDRRYAGVPWTGAAAAPDLGSPQCDELVEVLDAALADDALDRRNRLRAWVYRLEGMLARLDRDVEGAGRQARIAVLRDQRADALAAYRLAKSERSIAVRSRLQQARVQLSYFARNRATSVRAELQEDAAGMTRRRVGAFTAYVERRVEEVIDDVGSGIASDLADVARELDLPVGLPANPAPPVIVSAAPLHSRRLEIRLMTLLGAGFGLGAALTLSRLFADLAPQWAVAGAVGCAVVGVALTLWVITVRGVLHDRAVLDRWVAEVTTALRTAMEEWVATRVLAAESALSTAAAERDVRERARTDDLLARIDREMREHAVAHTRAVAVRDERAPAVIRALTMVRAELGDD